MQPAPQLSPHLAVAPALSLLCLVSLVRVPSLFYPAGRAPPPPRDGALEAQRRRGGHRLQPAVQRARASRRNHEAAAALCCKAGLRSCKELREAKDVAWRHTGLSATDLATLGTLGLVLPKLQQLYIFESAGAAGPDGVQRLATGLAVGALPAVTMLSLGYLHMGDAGALALAAALGRGAMPRLKSLHLIVTAIGDTGLVALAPALRRLPALEMLVFNGNPFGNEGLAPRGAAVADRCAATAEGRADEAQEAGP